VTADGYATFPLEADLSDLEAAERAMIPLLVRAGEHLDEVFWLQATGEPKDTWLARADPGRTATIERNIGPWDRLADFQPLMTQVGPRPPGAAFYPADLDPDELDAAAVANPDLRSNRTLVRRDPGGLVAVPYHKAFAAQLSAAAALLREAANLAPQADLQDYLRARATALETDDYAESDRAWLAMRSNRIDVVIGAMETYEDQLLGAKASMGTVVLVKDRSWSERLARFHAMLPGLQARLPVPEPYRRERPGVAGDLAVYDAIHMSGDQRAPTAVAMNLPVDEAVILEMGTRSIQMRNLMRARHDLVSRPTARLLLAEDQLAHVSFEAYFDFVMCHEVAHGLGLKQTIDGRRTVRGALRAYYNPIEEAKADTLGQVLRQQLVADSAMAPLPAIDRATTLVAELMRIVRTPASAYVAGSTRQLLALIEHGVLGRDSSGRWRVRPDGFDGIFEALAAELLRIQGDGDEAAAAAWCDAAILPSDLREDLARVNAAGIPLALYPENVIAG
jgi:hypothetical protein